MVSLHSNKTLIKTKVGSRDWSIAVIGLTMVLFGVTWALEDWVTRLLECIKCSLMDHTSRSTEDSGAECDVLNCGDQEVSEC